MRWSTIVASLSLVVGASGLVGCKTKQAASATEGDIYASPSRSFSGSESTLLFDDSTAMCFVACDDIPGGFDQPLEDDAHLEQSINDVEARLQELSQRTKGQLGQLEALYNQRADLRNRRQTQGVQPELTAELSRVEQQIQAVNASYQAGEFAPPADLLATRASLQQIRAGKQPKRWTTEHLTSVLMSTPARSKFLVATVSSGGVCNGALARRATYADLDGAKTDTVNGAVRPEDRPYWASEFDTFRSDLEAKSLSIKLLGNNSVLRSMGEPSQMTVPFNNLLKRSVPVASCFLEQAQP